VRSLRTSLPSVGVWLIVVSWVLVGGFFAWGAREPRLDRMRRELDEIARTEDAVASDWLVAELRREMVRYPALTKKLVGETGARALEARRDGFTRTPRFHIAIASNTDALMLETTESARVEVQFGVDRFTVNLEPRRAALLPLPPGLRGKPELVDAYRSNGAGEVRISGAAKTRTP
jgi:hypothetical protein